MKLGTKITWVFLLFALASLGIGGGSSYLLAKRILTRQALNQLQSVASIQKTRVEHLLDGYFAQLALVASRTQLRISLDRFNKERNSSDQQAMNRILRDARSAVAIFEDVSVFNPQGVVVVSTDHSLIGTTPSDQAPFKVGLEESRIEPLSLDAAGRSKFYLTAPLHLDNRLLGTVVIKVDTGRLLSLVQEHPGLGETGEMVLARRDKDGNALFLTPLRFDPGAALHRTVSGEDLNVPIVQALLQNEALFTDVIDYRGEPVLAVSKYIETTGWGLVVKIDKAEAFAPIALWRTILWLLALVFAGGALLIYWVAFRTIVRPITTLTGVARAIQEGGLSRRAEVRSNDEVGALGEAFNQMAASLAAKARQLETDIARRQDAEEELKHSKDFLETVLKNVGDAICIIDVHDFTVVMANEAFLKAYDMEEGEVLGKHCYSISHNRFEPCESCPLLDAVGTGSQAVAEHLHYAKDGKPFYTEIIASPIRDQGGKVIQVVHVSRDVTERRLREEEREEHRQRLWDIIEFLPDATFVIDEDQKVIAWNRALEAMTGIPKDEVLGKGEHAYAVPFYGERRPILIDLIGAPAAAGEGLYDVVKREGDSLFAEVFVPGLRGGKGAHIWIAASPLLDREGRRYGAIESVRDISKLKQAEAELLRSNRALRTLTECDQALVRAVDEEALLDDVCRILVEHGGYRMAWVGYAEEDEAKTVRPMARAGEENGYLETIRVTWDESEFGRGPTGTAIRTGAPSIARDISTEPAFAPWREEALKRGYASSIALPLKAEAKAFGSLNIYASAPDAFDTEEVRLLNELAEDLAYGVAALRNREALSDNLRFLQTLLDTIPSPVFYKDRAGIYRGCNTAFAEVIIGLTKEKIVGRSLFDLTEAIPADLARLYHRQDQALFRKPGVQLYEGEAQCADGNRRTFVISKATYSDAAGEVQGLVGVMLDISKRKRAEERLRQHAENLAALRTIDMAITGSLDLRLTLKVFLEQAIARLGVDAACVLLFSSHEQTLEYAAGQGFRTDRVTHSRVRLGDGYAGRIALERQSFVVADLAALVEDPAPKTLVEMEGFQAYVGVPLLAKGHIKGVLEIFHRAPLDPDREWHEFVESLAGQAAIALDNAELFEHMQRAHSELLMAYDTTIEGWSRALDYRDQETEGHSRRVTDMTVRVAREMGVSAEELVHVRRGALLHDIGKLGVPDSILLKPGKLTDEEWAAMKRHPDIAYKLLAPISFLRPVILIPYCHHEKWDGSGYPRGLQGEEIPLAARIFAVVDVWDALRSDRPYRPAWPEEKVREHVRSLSGSHFDPEVVEVFLEMEW